MTEPANRLELSTIFNALSTAIVVVDNACRIILLNSAAESLFNASANALRAQPLEKILGSGNPLLGLLQQTLNDGVLIKKYDHGFTCIKSPQQLMVNVHLTPLYSDDADQPTEALLAIEPQGMVGRLSGHVSQREGMKSASLMAEILAHEVKNPLSGIRGAAQLLAQDANSENRKLTKLICDEVDRINSLLGQIDFFSDKPTIAMEPLNIHEVLQYVISIAEKGFALDTHIIEQYDPSLPYVLANREMLVQLFLNLIKNAAEAVTGNERQEIRITTSYRSGYRFNLGSASEPHYVALPISIMVQDSGKGIPQELHDNLFDPFVTSKRGGKGLGLAVVAKIAADHGGVIELDEEEKGFTGFRLSLPVARDVKP